jgi:hypothetical protein
MIHFPSVRGSSIGPLAIVLVLWGLRVLLLGTLVSIVTNLSTVIASIGVVVGCTTLHQNIVGHSLAWCLIARLLLGVLAPVPLTRWLLVSLLKTLLRIGTWVGVASKSLQLELPLHGIHLLVLIVDYNSTIHKFLKARVDIGHQLQLETIIQPL